MPSFTITMQRTMQHTAVFSITASDEDTAAAKAEDIFAKFETYDKFEKDNKLEWELDDESYEVLDVNEE